MLSIMETSFEGGFRRKFTRRWNSVCNLQHLNRKKQSKKQDIYLTHQTLASARRAHARTGPIALVTRQNASFSFVRVLRGNV